MDSDPQLRRTARRLGLQTGGLILLCLVVGAAVQWVLVERSSESAARSRLADVTGSIDQRAEAPRDVLVIILDAAGERSSDGLPAGLPVRADLTRVAATGATKERSLRLSDHEYLVRTERTGSRTVEAALDQQPLEDGSHRLIVALLRAGIAGVSLAALVVSWLARRAVAPMGETIGAACPRRVGSLWGGSRAGHGPACDPGRRSPVCATSLLVAVAVGVVGGVVPGRE